MNISEQLKNPLFKLGFDYGFTIKSVWDEFNEDLHPRNEKGEFTDGEGSNGVPADAPDYVQGNYQQKREDAFKMADAFYEHVTAEREANKIRLDLLRRGVDPSGNARSKAAEDKALAAAVKYDDMRREMAVKYGSRGEGIDFVEVQAYFEDEWKSENVTRLVDTEARMLGMRPLSVEKLDHPISEKEIIDKLGGADKTRGSCSSLAFAYIANKYGNLDVEDMRGSQSKELFCKDSNILKLGAIKGVCLHNEVVGVGKNCAAHAEKCLKKMEEGKEYYGAFGGHAAMCRLHDGQPEYLELQAARSGRRYREDRKNEWRPLTRERLYNRFSCSERVGKGGFNGESCILLDAEKLGKDPQFQDSMKWLNTKRYARQEEKRKNKS